MADTVLSCSYLLYQSWMGKTARPVVCPAKAGVFSRRKACRGKSQKPRSLDSRVAGNQDSEACRQRLPREDDESPGRNDSERGILMPGGAVDWNFARKRGLGI